jgi:two-component system, sensor histidine kinase and response regulator
MDFRSITDQQMSLRGCRVLLIEDNAPLRDELHDLLKLMGHEVSTSPSGQDALSVMELMAPDIVITDIIMPEFDVFEALPELHRKAPFAKVIAISGNAHLLTLAVRYGADYVLEKPFKARQLDLLIRSALQSSAPRMQNASQPAAISAGR